MSILKTVDNILARFGNMRAMERTHVDTFTENNIANIEGELMGRSKFGQLWVHIQELGGYHFLNTTMLSTTNIKTFKGGKLSFSGGEDSFSLLADTMEIASDHSNVSNRYITQVSYLVTEEDIRRIQKGKFRTITFSFKKKELAFDKTDWNAPKE